MVQSDEEAITKFNDYVDMTADELEHWLKDPTSESAGWPKNADEEGGETVGHESGRKIVEILRGNPEKDPSKYPPSALPHIHKVVAYCARHLAQEGHMKETKTREELEKTESTKSLKNWGHDPIKTLDAEPSAGKEDQENNLEMEDKGKDTGNGKGKGKGKASTDEQDEQPGPESKDQEEDDDEYDDADVGDKRKRPVRKSAAKAAKADQATVPPLDDYDSAEDEDYESGGEESVDGGPEGSDVETSEEDDEDDVEGEGEEGGEEDEDEDAPPPKKTK